MDSRQFGAARCGGLGHSDTAIAEVREKLSPLHTLLRPMPREKARAQHNPAAAQVARVRVKAKPSPLQKELLTAMLQRLILPPRLESCICFALLKFWVVAKLCARLLCF